jgi:hypothetical protein
MKKKLNLTAIKVQSFVTELDKTEAQTVQGGQNTNNPVCNTEVAACNNTHAGPVCPDTILACSIGIACTYINCPPPL